MRISNWTLHLSSRLKTLEINRELWPIRVHNQAEKGSCPVEIRASALGTDIKAKHGMNKARSAHMWSPNVLGSVHEVDLGEGCQGHKRG